MPRVKTKKKAPPPRPVRRDRIGDIRFLLKLKDQSADGKWDYPTIARIDDIKKSVGDK